MLDILIDYDHVTVSIMMFKPILNEKGLIKDFEWRLINYTEQEDRLLLGITPGEKAIDLFKRYETVLRTGEPDEFLFSQQHDFETMWFQITVARFNGELIVCCTNVTESKKAQEQMEKSEEDFRLLAENATDVICRMDVKGHFLYVSPSSKRILGITQEGLLDKSIYEFIHPEHIEEVKEKNRKQLNDLRIAHLQFKFRKSNDRFIWIEAFTNPVQNSLGQLEIQTSLRDITRRKHIEQEIFELNNALEERIEAKTNELRTVLNNSPIVLWSVNNHRVMTSSEGQGLDLLGFNQGKCLGASIYDFYKDYPEVIDKIEDALNGESFADTITYEDRHYQIYYFPVRNSEDDITGMAAIATDFTKLAIVEQELVANETKYRSMVNGIPQLVWTADPSGEIDFVNKNWLDYTGLSIENSLKAGWLSVVHPDDIPPIYEKLGIAIKTGNVLEFEARYKTAKENLYRWHLVRVWSAKNQDGEIIKWLGTATDIHDQKASYDDLQRKNMELARTNNDLDNFIYTASHDLRAPISNMEGLLVAIQKEISNACSEDIITMLKMTEESLFRLRATINELTEISQVQKDIDADVEVLNISNEIENFKKEHRQEISAAQANISLQLEVEELTFSRKNFKTVLYNLLSNAIKYKHSDRSPEIIVKTQRLDAESIMLSVSDNGLGVKDADKNKMFRMFKRLHTHVEGTGIGLYIVKRVIQNIGGKIEVESILGEGTSIKVFLKN
jgi:PAS domain S-box-containing protein